MGLIYELPELQFYWRQTDKPGLPPNPVSDFLKFDFEFNSNLQLLKQKVNPTVVQSLERVYKEDFNVGYLDDENSLAKLYGNDFIAFLNRFITKNKNLKILEIGCGKGLLLNYLHGQGHNVTGLDPSPSAKNNNSEIRIIDAFFPTEKVSSDWDIVLHYDVLEHAEDAVEFLKAQNQILKDDGLLIFAVPDCTNGINRGDLSVILHEHINYFDEESLALTLKASGFKPLTIERSNNVGTIYCVASKEVITEKHSSDNAKFIQFKMRAERNISILQQLLLLSINENKTVGLYVPLRFLPYLSIFKLTNSKKIRFFDDSTAFKGKYFDGFSNLIEGGENLNNDPVDVLIVGSYVFGKRIMDRFIDLKGMEIYKVEDIFPEVVD